jgi:hypothetical protein
MRDGRIRFLFSMLSLLWVSTPVVADNLSERVTAYIQAHVHAALSNEPQPYDGDIENRIATPEKLSPNEMNHLAAGLAAVYPDFKKRTSLEGQVINEQGFLLRQQIAIALIQAHALNRATDLAAVRRALVKLLSLESHSGTRLAVAQALKSALPASTSLIVSELSSIAEANDDEMDVADFEKEYARSSIKAILDAIKDLPGCHWRVQYARFI